MGQRKGKVEVMRNDLQRQTTSALAAVPRIAVGWRLAAAGGAAGALTNCILFPLDTVKTLRQADPVRFPGALPAALSVLRRQGLRGLYAGISPALVGSALSSALYFGTYEFVRRRMRRARRLGSGSGTATFFASPVRRIPGNALAAASGNIASSVLFVPKEVVKQRMQAGVDTGQFVGAALGLIRADGVAGLYRGYKATLLRNIPSTVLRFVLYEEAKLMMQGVSASPFASRKGAGKSSALSPLRQLSTLQLVGAGAISGAIASAITTPMDVIKTTLATGKSAPGAGIVQVAADIVKQRGVAGLYVGIRPRVLWSGLFAAIGFSTYEVCKSWLAPKYDIHVNVADDESERKPTRGGLHQRQRISSANEQSALAAG
jgi:solute carrier family 25 (mitochondrial S-adenosylmethionine transporter), member 26